MNVKSYRTPIIQPGCNLVDMIIQHGPVLQEKSILVITSKILSLSQNRIIPITAALDKLSLIKQEADLYLEGDYSKKYGICLTIKNDILIPTAGIDESNSNDHYILYPVNIAKEMTHIWNALRDHYHLQALGVLLTDSHTTPLRRGVTGIALGWCGFKPLHNYVGTPDIYGKLLRVTQSNIVDSLATAAVFLMGEGDEQRPLALITDIDTLVFEAHPPSEQDLNSVVIPMSEDLYAPLITSVSWKKGTRPHN